MLNRQIPVRSHHPVQRPPKYMIVSPDSAAHPAHKITKPTFSEPPCAAAPAVSKTTDNGSGKPHDPSSRITAVVAYPWCSTTASQSIVRVPWGLLYTVGCTRHRMRLQPQNSTLKPTCICRSCDKPVVDEVTVPNAGVFNPSAVTAACF